MSEINSEIAELLRQAAEKEQEARINEELNKKTSRDSEATAGKSKIESDRLEQGESSEQLQALEQAKKDGKIRSKEIESEVAKILETKETAQASLEASIGEESKAIYASVLEKLGQEEERLNSELAKIESTDYATDSYKHKEFIRSTQSEAQEILGYDKKTRVVKDYFNEQREFLAEPEMLKDQIDALADAIIKDYDKRIRERLKNNNGRLAGERSLFSYTKYLGGIIYESSPEIQALVAKSSQEWRRQHGGYMPEADKSKLAKEITAAQKKFEADLFRNPLLMKALENARLQKAEEYFDTLEKGKEYPRLSKEDLAIARESADKDHGQPLESYSLRKTIWTHRDLEVRKPEAISSLPEEDQQKIEAAIANSSQDFTDLAKDLGLNYNEATLEKIQEEALAENEKIDKEKRIGQIEEALQRKLSKIDQIQREIELNSLLDQYKVSRDAVWDRKSNENNVKNLKGSLKLYKTDLDGINLWGWIREHSKWKSLRDKVAEYEKKITAAEELVNGTPDNPNMPTADLIKQHEDLINQIIEFNLESELRETRTYKADAVKKDRSSVINGEIYVSDLVHHQGGKDRAERNREEEIRLKDSKKKLEDELAQLQK